MKATGDAIARALAEFDGHERRTQIRRQRHERFMEIGQSPVRPAACD